ncbi:hypothetical protein GCM10011611_46710 [Aliidongia dinghuensis]|uniref:DUF3466 family protein n=1 Tax=Aliidongia dinghuensis TaxID=1867774 RepID=A0A8J2YYW4_9PROT|nr:hypothetical protein GCM10011611_46710 [Aliidongia dinghuensis]
MPILAAVALALLAAPGASAETAQPAAVPSSFTIRNLGAFPGDYSGDAAGINNWGDAVGYSLTDDFVNFVPVRPVLFANRQVFRFHSLPYEPPGFDRGSAVAINDEGVAVGTVFAAKGPTHAAQFAPSATSDLGTVLPDGNSYATGINNRGQVVGYADAVLGENGILTHAVRYAGGKVIDLGVLPGGSYSYATGINDQGVAVGYATTATGSLHAVSFANGQIADLGVPPGGSSSMALGINNQGQAVGSADFGTGASHAALFANGTITDLGTLPGGANSVATAINNLGQAVGWSDNGTGFSRPVLFVRGQVIDLGTFAGITNAYPAAINDLGQVVGTVELAISPDPDLQRTLGVMWTPAAQAIMPRQVTGTR